MRCNFCHEPMHWWQDRLERRDKSYGVHDSCLFIYITEAVKQGMLPSPERLADKYADEEQGGPQHG